MTSYTVECTCRGFSAYTTRRREAIQLRNLHENLNAAINRDEEIHAVTLTARVERPTNTPDLEAYA